MIKLPEKDEEEIIKYALWSIYIGMFIIGVLR